MSRFPNAILAPGAACALSALFLTGLLALRAEGQGPPKAPVTDPIAATSQAVSLAERGRCAEALPALRRNTARVQDKKLRYRAAIATARCAMSLNDTSAAADALSLLHRDFPDDPEVLYVSARFFSQLANRAAQELAERFPASPQLGKLNAEALESRRMWDEAIEAYRKIIEQDPKLPDIRFRIARILLDRSQSAEAAAEAKKELEEELKVNPQSAVAEFVLAEIARREGDWSTAIQHFSRASQLDAGFFEAYLALGMSLASAGKHAEAIAPLQQYAKNVPNDPAGHYQLAIAYSRTGNKEAADRELQLHREALSKSKMRRPPDAPPPQ